MHQALYRHVLLTKAVPLYREETTHAETGRAAGSPRTEASCQEEQTREIPSAEGSPPGPGWAPLPSPPSPGCIEPSVREGGGQCGCLRWSPPSRLLGWEAFAVRWQGIPTAWSQLDLGPTFLAFTTEEDAEEPQGPHPHSEAGPSTSTLSILGPP